MLAFTVQGLSLLTRVGGHHRAKQQHAATTTATSAPPPPHHRPGTHAFSTQTPPRPPPGTSHRPSPSMPLAHQTRLRVAHVLAPPSVNGGGPLHLPQRSSPPPTTCCISRHIQLTCVHDSPSCAPSARTSRTPASDLAQRVPPSRICWHTQRASHPRATTCTRRFSPTHDCRGRRPAERSVAGRRNGVLEQDQQHHRVAHHALGQGVIEDGSSTGGGGCAACR